MTRFDGGEGGGSESDHMCNMRKRVTNSTIMFLDESALFGIEGLT